MWICRGSTDINIFHKLLLVFVRYFKNLVSKSLGLFYSLHDPSVNGVFICDVRGHPYACSGLPADLYIVCASISLVLLTVYLSLNLYNLVRLTLSIVFFNL